MELARKKRFHAVMLVLHLCQSEAMQARKTSSGLLAQATYAPADFFDYLRSRLDLPTDAALARHLMITPSMLSRMRRRQLAISPEVLLKVHDCTRIPIKRLKLLMGDGRRYFS